MYKHKAKALYMKLLNPVNDLFLIKKRNLRADDKINVVIFI
jgi:hypothetical protein